MNQRDQFLPVIQADPWDTNGASKVKALDWVFLRAALYYEATALYPEDANENGLQNGQPDMAILCKWSGEGIVGKPLGAGEADPNQPTLQMESPWAMVFFPVSSLNSSVESEIWPKKDEKGI